MNDEKMKKIKKDINISHNNIIILQKENLELNNKLNNKDEEMKNIQKDLEQSKIILNSCNEQIQKEEGEIENSKIFINNYENQISKYKNEINQISLQNDYDKNKNEEIQKKLDEQKEKYKNELIIIKTNLENKLRQDYENKFNAQIEIMAQEIYNEIKNRENELHQKYIKDNEQAENDLGEKLLQMSTLAKSNILQKKDISCSTVHFNIKCQQCLKNPITGYRYKCPICEDYNLCEDCEEKNSHPQNFIKIRNSQKSSLIIDKNFNYNNNLNNNIINNKDSFINNDPFNNNYIEQNIHKNNDDKYSYDCLDKKLSFSIYAGESKAVITIILKNNGEQPWIKYKTTLKFDKNNSVLKGADILLKPQVPDQESSYQIVFNGLEKLKKGEYKACYKFNVNGIFYVKDLNITLIIK